MPTSSELLATLVEHAHDVIVSTSLDGTVWSWNPAAERLYGWSAAEIMGRSVHVVVPAHRRAEVDGVLLKVARGEPVERHDTERVRKDGRTLVVSLSVSPLHGSDGAVIGAATFARDVTTERAAAAELERCRLEEQHRGELLDNLVHNSHDAILTKDLDGVVWSWNPAAERLYGWSAAEVVGRRVHLIAPPHRHDEIDEILAALRRGESVQRHDTERLTKDGRTVLINLSVSPLRDADGSLIGAAAIAHDVTALRRAAAELEQRAAHETEARHLRDLAQLAGTVAHDVGNSLGAILMTSAALRRSLPAAVADGQPVGPLLDQLEDITAMTGDLVAALSDYGNEREPERGRCDLDGSVAELLPVLARLAGPARHLRCLASVDGMQVGLSRAELDTMLINLVTNAVHATGDGGTITVSTDLVAAGPAAALPGRRRLVRLRVADDGCGMDEAVRQRAFQPLFTTRNRADGGSGRGLGLASVHRIVTAAGGSAEITSSPGRGTTVEILLPVREPGPEPGS